MPPPPPRLTEILALQSVDSSLTLMGFLTFR